MVECADVGPELGPLQVGVGAPGGPQCMGHAVQTGLDNHPRDITVQLDCKKRIQHRQQTAHACRGSTHNPPTFPLSMVDVWPAQ